MVQEIYTSFFTTVHARTIAIILGFTCLLVRGMEHEWDQRAFEKVFDAVKKRNIEEVRSLLDTENIDINGMSERYPRFLSHCAISNIDVEMLQLLIEYGVDLTMKHPHENCDAFKLAIGIDKGDGQKLATIRAMILKTNWLTGKWPTWYVNADQERADVFQQITQSIDNKKADSKNINGQDEVGATALIYAARMDRYTDVALLLDRGASPLLKTIFDATACDIVALRITREKRLDVCQSIIELLKPWKNFQDGKPGVKAFLACLKKKKLSLSKDVLFAVLLPYLVDANEKFSKKLMKIVYA